jgi:chemotaxis protein MotB
MRKRLLVLLIISIFVLNGCAVVFQKGRRSDIEKIQTLKDELTELRAARQILAERLSKEIDESKIRLSMAEKGLVITFVAEVLFNSGKEKLRRESLPILDKIVRILNEEVPGNDIGIEGHTDNDPIKYSRWKSNWELSTQRALGVLYYLESEGVGSERLSAIGYGEYQPVASNDSKQGRKLNRRVEVVILPKSSRGVSQQDSPTIEEEELK